MDPQQIYSPRSLFREFPSAETLLIIKNGCVIFDAHNDHPYEPLPSAGFNKAVEIKGDEIYSDKTFASIILEKALDSV